MNTYKWFYRGKSGEVTADSSYHAQLAAAALVRARKSFEVTVMLVQRADGTEVIHTAVD